MPHDTAFAFRPVTDADLAMLADWRARAHVARWWGDPPPPAELREECLATPGVRALIALAAGRPVGFVQVYVVRGAGDGWWPDETDPGARGIDLFLAHAEDVGTGLGTAMLRALLDWIFADPAVTKVQADPAPANGRAIAAYAKAGFERVGIVETPDGPAELMVCPRRAR